MKNLRYIFLLIPCVILSQTLDYETITGSKPLQVSGQVEASGVYYNSNQNETRVPFSYFLQGVLNVNVYSFAIPISYSISNQGENLGYQLPFDFNRISLHPRYKWITAHIGSVNMSFSPYTYNGHQFSGAGLELTPPGSFSVSAMSGRLLKAVNNDDNQNTIPSFNRMGYGLRTTYAKPKYKIGFIGFYAKDDQNSIDVIPEDKGVVPKENLVISIEGQLTIGANFSVDASYATSAITNDLRAERTQNPNNSIIGAFFSNRSSTSYYDALKANLGYNFSKATLGLGYERIDPGYETLGAYFLIMILKILH